MSCTLRTMLVAIAATLAPAAAAGPPAVDRLIVFGDSLSDTGNTDDLTLGFVPGAAYWNGRYSNGPVWVEQLGFAAPPPTASRLGGTNYAFGGANTGPGFSNIIIPNVGTQIGTYSGSGPAPAAGDLHVVLAASNDFVLSGRDDPSVPVANLVDHITELATHGATRLLVGSVPPLGRVPRFLGTADQDLYDGLSASFNGQYAAALDALQAQLDVTIHRIDVHGLMELLIAQPASFGFTNVTEPAYDEATGTVVPDPEHYLFWDDLHPTTAAHAALAMRAASRIRCPADTDGNGEVDVDDLVAVVLDWGTTGFSLRDVDDTGLVDVDDLLAVVLAWGACP